MRNRTGLRAELGRSEYAAGPEFRGRRIANAWEFDDSTVAGCRSNYYDPTIDCNPTASGVRTRFPPLVRDHPEALFLVIHALFGAGELPPSACGANVAAG